MDYTKEEWGATIIIDIGNDPDMYEALKELLTRFAFNTDRPTEQDDKCYEMGEKAIAK